MVVTDGSRVGGAWGAGEGEVEVHSEVAAMEETAVEGGASMEVARVVRVEKEVEKEALVNRVEREAMVEDYGDWAEAPESVMTVASWGPVAIREACLGGVTAWGGASAVEAMEELAKTGVHFPWFCKGMKCHWPRSSHPDRHPDKHCTRQFLAKYCTPCACLPLPRDDTAVGIGWHTSDSQLHSPRASE